MLPILLTAFASLGAGLALGIFLSKGRAAAIGATLEAEKRRTGELNHSLAAATGRESLLQREITALREQQAAFGAELTAERRNSAEKLALLVEAREQLSNQFKTLANEILEEKSKRFTEQNEKNVGALMAPLREKFGEFQQKVEALQADGIAGRAQLYEQIGQLKVMNDRLSLEASGLVNALKGSSKTQGDWGELILEKLLEDAGLKRGRDYTVQEGFTREDNSRARLDVLLRLPGERHIVIDSKVSLNDYNEACNCEEPGRAAARARHVAAMRRHVRDLSERSYQSLYGLTSVDFVVMFVPIEPAFLLAIQHDEQLWQECWQRKVLLVSGTTLLFILKTVAQLWQQERQTKSIQEIVRTGGQLYDKLAGFAEDLLKVGARIDSARGSYEDAMKKLSSSRGAIWQAEKLRALGIKPNKQMPAELRGLDQDLGDTISLAATADENENRG